MAKKRRTKIDYQSMELEGTRYVIVRESVFKRLCKKAGVDAERDVPSEELASELEMDPASLAAKLLRLRQAAGLSQAELARRASVRPETLNRIERGRTTPGFATIRKLVKAINAAELEGNDF